VKMNKSVVLFLILALAVIPSAMAQTRADSAAVHTAVPYPTTDTPKATDRGALAAQRDVTAMSITVALPLRNLSEAENLLRSVSTPGDPQYHKFLSSGEFVARFAPTNAEMTKVIAGLAKYGLTAVRATATTLKVTGMPANMERAFGVSLHSYEVPAHGNAPAYSYHAPVSRPTIPAEISGSVSAVIGLDNRPSFRPLLMDAAGPAQAKLLTAAATGGLINPPGLLTVADFASYYDVVPLYDRGITGKGRTLGIMTLASFTPSDAFAYWAAVGLTVDPSRITIVNVDGGPGAPSDASGSRETTIDVEQSGGIAPGANVIVYQAPNTSQGFVDLFAAAVDANQADSLSVSWTSGWEWFNNLENNPVTDPISGQTVSTIQAIHESFLRAGLQGETVIASSGDGGAYEANWDLGCYGPYSPSVDYSCSRLESVGYPASDPAITAGGGTTLASIQEFCLNASCTPPLIIDIPHERVWGWDWLEPLCVAMGYPDPVSCGIFPIGSGGGVSITFDVPVYQWFLPGVLPSAPGQVWETTPYIGSLFEIGTYYALPGNFPGRNIPDVSFNADPDTGYVVYYTSSVSGFGIHKRVGGTSFVAPQLNGVSTLLGQDARGRLGLLNYQIYWLAFTGQAYGGPHPPFHAIAYGDNWFYYGRDGYAPAAGVGTMDVANFANLIAGPF